MANPPPGQRPIKKLLCANRGEIAIRVFRACDELGIKTVAIYSDADALAPHRYKADEAYEVGKGLEPVAAYLSIDEVIRVAKECGADAIHPGYGFLAENPELVRACTRAGLTFVGPPAKAMEAFGDKRAARRIAAACDVPTVPGIELESGDPEEAVAFANKVGYPVIIKAAFGGGGRGMRVAQDAAELRERMKIAASEAGKAFGNPAVFVEKLVERPKHIEVQILADSHGNVLHLFERDCSVQRRHQKVVELAPALTLPTKTRDEMCAAAVRIAQHVNYVNAGTVEMLLGQDGKWYFIEVNPRIQVEHTVTEMVTGVDIVQSQLRIAEGHRLSDPEINLPSQSAVHVNGFAIQCRITSEDPSNQFVPDTGRVDVYRSPAGFGVRLDGGVVYQGAEIAGHYDSLLVKCTTHDRTFVGAARKMARCLREFRIRGIKTNLPFLLNLVQHPTFLAGGCDTAFIERNPSLFDFPASQDRATRLMRFIAERAVNPPKDHVPGVYFPAPMPQVSEKKSPMDGTRQIFLERGADGLVDWIRQRKRVLVTDTTFRDAHQSLLATRVRTRDMLAIAPATAVLAPGLFSHEVWGGATFDAAFRFLKESPWTRLEQMRERIPNVLFQMLLRGSNAVGYTNYADNVVREFVRLAKRAGVDIFRIFDCLNWTPQMRVAIEAVREHGGIAEAAICYTGDLTSAKENKYTLDYYVKIARELKEMGAHLLAIKDMAGLLKPHAAAKLIPALKQETGLPVHLHTHNTSGNQMATLLRSIEVGVDIVDCAISSMADLTSQPSLNGLVGLLEGTERDTGLSLDALKPLARYWEVVRGYYAQFESGLRTGTADVYRSEIPGGQYSNLRPQALSLGLFDRWDEMLELYAQVNVLLGNIPKVTPSSKMVGDLALFMLRNGLTPENVLERGRSLDFPDSVIGYMQGKLGMPPGGFPEPLRTVVLKGRDTLKGRPGELLPPVDFEKVRAELLEKHGGPVEDEHVISSVLYPSVFDDYIRHRKRYGLVSLLDTRIFHEGMKPGESGTIELEPGKTLFLTLNSISEVAADGTREVVFELNGARREVRVADTSSGVKAEAMPMADKKIPGEVGATMPGSLVKLFVTEGQKVEAGAPLLTLEAMKMETQVTAPIGGVIRDVMYSPGDRVETGALLLRVAS
jgi:pyruvate carboxylase